MKKTNIYLTENMRSGLSYLAKQTGLTSAEHVRRAIDDYLKKKEKINERKI
jgi:predicted DNA-binding protein